MAVVSARSIVLFASMLVLGGSARAAEAAKECPPGMLLVSGGTFRMGSEDGFPDEWPVLQRKVESFCLDRTEVTVEAYRKFLKERNEDIGVVVARWPEMVRSEVRDWTSFCNLNVPGREQHPVNCIDWQQAEAYCRAHGWRLPIEEEFEYAARGGDQQRHFPWGDEPPDPSRLNACGTECFGRIIEIRGGWSALYDVADAWPGTSPVGSFPKGDGRWGHADLAGNVWEWTGSAYCPYDEPGCFSDVRIVRGSGFLQTNLRKARATRRNFDADWHAGGDVGFRCASSLGPNPPTPSIAWFRSYEHERPDSRGQWMMLGVSLLLMLVVGMVLGLLGGGGSVLTLPILLFVVGFENVTAPSAALAIMAVTGLASTAAHARHRRVRWNIALLFGLTGFGGAFLGSMLARVVPDPFILLGFSILMVFTARAMLKRNAATGEPTIATEAPLSRSKIKMLVLCGGSVGVLSGFLGVGGGFLIVPVLSVIVGLPMAMAVGTSTLIITLNSASSLISRENLDAVDWVLVAQLGAMAVIGTLLGSQLTGRVRPQRLRQGFAVLIVVVGAIVMVRRAIPEVREMLRSGSVIPISQRQERG